MPNPNPASVEEQILATLDQCILKISNHLQKTFNPEDKESLQLFRQFCSALNARRQWLKSLENGSENAQNLTAGIQKKLQRKPLQDFSEPVSQEKKRIEPMLNAPPKPEPWKNGLLVR